ncbi:MAG: hypothetical protein VKL98_10050 [Cyanobacteriota bacterium]|nr:hypothetical protein [Cyanobacteriota bacterium]
MPLNLCNLSPSIADFTAAFTRVQGLASIPRLLTRGRDRSLTGGYSDTIDSKKTFGVLMGS